MTPLEAIQVIFQTPPIPYEAPKHSLKGWAKYCLQTRGFRVVYADKADFAVETQTREKLYFRVSDRPADLDPKVNWIIWNADQQSAQVQVATE
ncbi:MAG: hypothetical protein AAFY26_00105 [Cyanobacteria bacterium J06638_22]